MPPPSSGSTPPPPPPPSETAWGGQAPTSYGTPYGTGGYYGPPAQSVANLGNWSRILIGVTALAGTVSGLLPNSAIGQTLGFFNLVAVIAAGVVTIIWLYRIAENLRTLGRQITFGPLWAIFGWFILPFVWIIPALQLNELWKASDPSPNWQSSSTNWKIWAWFAMGPLSAIVSISQGFSAFEALSSADTDGEINRALEQSVTTASIITAIITVAAAGFFILVNTDLTNRHESLLATVRQ